MVHRVQLLLVLVPLSSSLLLLATAHDHHNPTNASASGSPSSVGAEVDLLLSGHLIPDPADAPLGLSPSVDAAAVARICRGTGFPAACVAAARLYASPGSHINPTTVLSMQVRLASESIKAAKVGALRVIGSDPSGIPMGATVQGILQGCVEDYDGGLRDLYVGLKTAAGGKGCEDAVRSSLDHLEKAVSGIEGCNGRFYEMPGMNPMEKKNEMLVKIVSNTICIAKQIHKS